jgi:hypothetical protein
VERPIIRSRVPPWMLARDVILTLGAWAIIAYFFHEGIARAIDYFSPPMFELTRTSPPDWAYRWAKLRGFLALAAGLVLWIAFWAFDSRARMRTTSAGDLDLWRSAKVQTVDIDATLHAERRG